MMIAYIFSISIGQEPSKSMMQERSTSNKRDRYPQQEAHPDCFGVQKI